MISWFASDFFARSPVLIYPLVALVIFVAVFTAVTVRALLRRSSELDALARLPLEDDAGPTEQREGVS